VELHVLGDTPELSSDEQDAALFEEAPHVCQRLPPAVVLHNIEDDADGVDHVEPAIE
jgi:hypothetical protein